MICETKLTLELMIDRFSEYEESLIKTIKIIQKRNIYGSIYLCYICDGYQVKCSDFKPKEEYK